MKITTILLSIFLTGSILKTLFEAIFLPRVLYPEWDLTYCAPLTDNPKRLWAYWKEGPKHLTLFVNQNLHTWKHIVDKGGWEIRVLHDADPTSSCYVTNFIPRDMLPRTFEDMYPQISSDSVRLALLRLHGGIYMDATIILLQDLDTLFWDRINLPDGDPQKIIIGGFHNDWFNQPGTRNGIELWMLAAKPHEPLVVAWHDLFLKVMNDTATPYVYNTTSKEIHPLLNGTDLEVMKGWANYLCGVSVFKAILTHNPIFNEQYNTMSKTLSVWNTSFRLYDQMGQNNEKVDDYLRQIKYPSANVVHEVTHDIPLIKLMGHAATLKDEQLNQWGNPGSLVSMVRLYIASRSQY
jgi:hypothetical protein